MRTLSGTILAAAVAIATAAHGGEISATYNGREVALEQDVGTDPAKPL